MQLQTQPICLVEWIWRFKFKALYQDLNLQFKKTRSFNLSPPDVTGQREREALLKKKKAPDIWMLLQSFAGLGVWALHLPGLSPSPVPEI